ncbi:PorV/PorQ family protein [candidate division FCPU426 bacterium]|nr:PorV/PorQ family protein [candidate division FCPU426 bacterium]
MKKAYVLGLAWILCFGFTPLAEAGGTGTSGAQILQQQNGARPAGLGGAYAACSRDVYAVNVNPAGVHNLDKIGIMLMHAAGFEGLSTEYLVGMVPLPGLGVLGGQFLYRGQPAIDNAVAGEATVNCKEMVYGLTFARPLPGGFSLGLSAKLLSIELGPVDATALSLDMGAQYQWQENLSLGLALRNLGTPVMFRSEEDPLPFTAVVGAAFTPYDSGPHRLLTVMDVDYLAPEENVSLRLGGEYWFRRMLALRLGYVHSAQKTVRGLSLGVGFRFKAGDHVDLALDYTLLPQFWEDEDFETENLFTLSVSF